MDHDEFMKFVHERAAQRKEKKKCLSIADQLKARLIKLGWNVDTIERLRPGHWQRSAGAWLWCANGTYEGGGKFSIGGCETMADCLKMDDAQLRRELSGTIIY